MAEQPIDRRGHVRPPDDELAPRLEAIERRIVDLQRAHIQDVEARIERRVLAMEERLVQVETTAVNGHGLLLQKVETVQQTVDRQGAAQANFRDWMQAQQTKDQLEAADLHDRAIAEKARADLLLQQQQAAVRTAGRRNRGIAGGIAACGTMVAGIGTWLFTQAGHETPSAVAFAVSGLVIFILLIVFLAWRLDPAATI